MLNLLKSKTIKNTKLYYKKTLINFVNENKHFPPASQEWTNSIYQYNKYNLIKILTLDNHLFKLIRSIFSLKDKRYKKIFKFKKFRKWQKFTYNTNKILISDPQIKYRNDNLIVNIYLYNRDKLYYLSLLKTISIRNHLKITNKFSLLNDNYFDQKSKEILLNRKKLRISKTMSNKLNIYLMKKINKLKVFFFKSSRFNYLNNLKQYLDFKDKLKELFWKKYLISLKKNNKIATFKSYIIFNKKFNNYCFKFEKIIFQREMLIILLKKSLLIDKFKTHETLLLPLRKLMYDILKKNVIFNLINLKRPLYNNSLLARLLVSKTNNRKLNARRAGKGILIHVRPVYDQRLDYFKEKLPSLIIQKIALNQKIINFNKDILTSYLKNKFYYFKEKFSYNNQLSILENLRNKNICGVRLIFSGRITRRIIAERAIRKIYYIGHIKNTDASYRGVPNFSVRGQLRSNLDYYKISSKTRIGAYGIKSWVNLR